jgi:WS/DGAT/MGAT family acyltransferase
MDAFFLYGEREDQPMHVGAVCIFEGKIPFTKFVKNLEARLHLVPRYRQRVLTAPLNVGHPTWEDDPDFDIRNHVFKVKVKAPGGEKELRQLAGKVFTGALDRNKPLWEIYVVEGLAKGEGALIFKVHHCMVDGVAGIGLAMVLFDMVPDAPRLRKKPYKAPPLPDTGTLLYDAIWDTAIESVEHWARFQRSLVAFSQSLNGTGMSQALKKFGSTMGNFLVPLTQLPFNKQMNGHRIFAWRQVSFSDARAIRAVAGGTVNDVVLATLGTATRKYLESSRHVKKLPRFMRVLCPVNVRQEHERGALGNRISFLPVEVPLHLDDPIERLHAVHLTTKELKVAKVPDAVSLMFDAIQGLPAPFQAASLGAVSKPTVQQMLLTMMPPGNMICTNVPGPQIPLYVVGKRLKAMYPKVPVVMEMGINLAITSYDQKMFLCFCADGKAGRDVERMAQFFDQAFEDLRAAAEVKQADYVRITRTAQEAVS